MRSEPPLTDPLEHLGVVTTLLIGSESTLTKSQLSHLGTLECAWNVMIFCNDGTMSRFSHFQQWVPLCCLHRLPLLICLWQSSLILALYLKCFRAKKIAFGSSMFMCSPFFLSDQTFC